jgi:hypothetical protein
VTEGFRHIVLAKTHQFSTYRKIQNYQNKMCITDCKKFYNHIRQKNTNVKNAPTKEEIENSWKQIFERKFNTMKKLTESKTSANKIPV